MSDAERAGASRQNENERLLAGRYRLGGVLGRGGMGTVWRAEDETLGRTVAVKELRFPSSIDEDEKRRLITRTLREAKAIARIRNTSAVTVYDVVDEDDRPWIVMELVEGKSLAEVIREDGLLKPKRAAEVGLAILDVLRSAHREGILHRDVKPSNVLISEDGRVVLTDFGIAQVEGDPSITSTGMLVGAPSYISPERARGHKPGPAADMWSLGGLLYAAVEGAPPYDKGSAIATLTAVMTEPLEEPKNAGPLKDVIYGLLTKDPAQRLDDSRARAMLTAVIHAPEPKQAEPEPEPAADATRVVPLPAQPQERAGGERLRGALRSVRKAAGAASTSAAAARAKSGSGTGSGTAGSGSGGSGTAGSGTAGSGGAKVPAQASEASSAPSASPAASATPAAPASSAPSTSGRKGAAGVSAASEAASTSASTSATASASTGAAGVRDGKTRQTDAVSDGRSSGWPVMTPPPDMAPRPVPRAPLTDVVPRRTLVIIAVVVALAVIGTVLALTLGGGDGSDGAEGGGAKVTASTSASAGTKEDKSGGTRTDGSTAGSPSSEAGTGSSNTPGAEESGRSSGGSSGSGGSADEGAVASTYRGGQGYSIGLPKGWKFQTSSSAGDRFTGPDGQKLLVGWTSAPKGDPVADWENQERGMRRSQYTKIRIEKVDYRSWNTADWEFTYVDGGTKYRTIDRGFVVDDHLGYGLMYTAKAANWGTELRKDTWQTLARTFEPKS
ncbi:MULTISPECIES: serine/threonine-protein kinase [Streptomyces]|nr:MULTISPECIES: serine/threonine-protein kinase [Streptomyces]MYT07874.1 protein kinase [Streptomyces sp. SID5470]